MTDKLEQDGWVQRPGGGWLPTQEWLDRFQREYDEAKAAQPALTPCPDWCDGGTFSPMYDHTAEWFTHLPGMDEPGAQYARDHQVACGEYVQVTAVEIWRGDHSETLYGPHVVLHHDYPLEDMDGAATRQLAADLAAAADLLDEIGGAA